MVQTADRIIYRTKGMTLEDISVLFGDPVELSFEQALDKEQSHVKDRGTTEEKRSSEDVQVENARVG